MKSRCICANRKLRESFNFEKKEGLGCLLRFLEQLEASNGFETYSSSDDEKDKQTYFPPTN